MPREKNIGISPVEATKLFQRNSSDCWFSHRANILWMGRYDQSTWADVSNHEFNHFLAHCSTPYGAFLDDLGNLRTSIFTSMLNAARPYHIRVPMYEHARIFLTDPIKFASRFTENIKNECEEFVAPWADCVLLERILEGENLPSVADANESTAVDLLTLAELRLRSGNGFNADLVRSSARDYVPVTTEFPYESACPKGHKGKKKFPIGAHHVLEGLAQAAESGASMIRVLKSNNFLSYMSLYVSAVSAFGPNRIKNSNDFASCFFTFLTLCDLALLTPIGTRFGSLRQPNTKWRDVHPASRYFRALIYVANNNLWISKTPGAMRRLQHKICISFGWPTPNEFIRVGKINTTANYKRHANAFQMRSRRYDSFLSTSNTIIQRKFLRRHPPIYRFEWEDRTVIDERWAGDALVNYLLANLEWDFMLGNEIRLEKLLPPSVKYSICFENISSDHEFIELCIQDFPALGRILRGPVR